MSNNKKGFTLIELLVVVAIIGILAAVGVVAYNGYTTSAKNNAVKQIHKQIAKFMSAELMKCTIGGERTVDYVLAIRPLLIVSWRQDCLLLWLFHNLFLPEPISRNSMNHISCI